MIYSFYREKKMAQQTIDLTKLNLMQLTQFKNQLDQDLTFYQESLQNLKHAQSKWVSKLVVFLGKKYDVISISNLIFFRFQDSGDSLGKLTPENKDKEILVPLTGSMYVPGQLSNAEKVLVDVGTGKKIWLSIHLRFFFIFQFND